MDGWGRIIEHTLERALGKFKPITAAFSCVFPLSSRFHRSRSLSTVFFFKKRSFYSQLSISSEQVWVSRGKRLRSMLHMAVTVTLHDRQLWLWLFHTMLNRRDTGGIWWLNYTNQLGVFSALVITVRNKEASAAGLLLLVFPVSLKATASATSHVNDKIWHDGADYRAPAVHICLLIVITEWQICVLSHLSVWKPSKQIRFDHF